MTIHTMSAEQIRNAVREGSLRAVEVAEHFLQRIEKFDSELGSFLSILQTSALEQAKQVDAKREAGKPLGRLAGVPIAIKDNINIRHQTTSCASEFLTNHTALFDATVVELLVAEDAVLLGKTNLDEFAMGSSNQYSALQQTSNPWNTKHVPGGSSGGSAVAVAARLCPLALGSDTGGSVRQPAGLCGIVGMKPTYGRVSRYGLVAFGSSLDQIGPFATNARDIGLLMEVLGTHCPKDSTSLPKDAEEYLSTYASDLKGKRVGYAKQVLAGMDGNVEEDFQRALRVMRDAGAEVVELDLPLLDYGVAVYYILATAEASTNLARFDGVRYGKRSQRAKTLSEVYDFSKEEGFGPEVKRRIMLGTYVLSAGYQDAYYRKAQKVRTLIIRELEAAFKSCDFLVSPTSPTAAWEKGSITDPIQEYMADLYTITANLGGLPAISVPSGFTNDGLPTGLQIMGPQGADVAVCSAAHVYEQATGYATQIPPTVNR